MAASRSNAKKTEPAEPKTETTDYVVPYVGLPVRVIKDGGAWDRPGTIAAITLDDEEDVGTWMTIITDPESNEHLHIEALRKWTEQECRDASAKRRNRYYTWLIEPEVPAEPPAEQA